MKEILEEKMLSDMAYGFSFTDEKYPDVYEW